MWVRYSWMLVIPLLFVGCGGSESPVPALTGQAATSRAAEEPAVQIWRAEYLINWPMKALRVYVNAPTNAVLEVYNAEGDYCYGKMSWAGGNYYVLSRIQVPDPKGKVKVKGTLNPAGPVEVERAVVYR